MSRYRTRMVALLLAAQTICLPAARAQAAVDAAGATPLLPHPALVQQVLAQLPAFRAALQETELAQLQRGLWVAGDPAWAATASTAQRRVDDALPARSSEWELSLQRNIRLPGKTWRYERAGLRRLEQAKAHVLRAWREQSRQLLELCSHWWRDNESSRVWASQVDLLRQQRDAVNRRQRIGTAAVLEQHQAEAALAQARAQAEAASGRAAAARQVLARRFPGLDMPTLQAVPAPEPLPDDDARWLQRLGTASVDVSAARREVAMAEAQVGIDEAERRPDPTVALRVGRARNGTEQVVGLSLSVPFGGEARQVAARASAARATAAERLLEDAQRQSDAESLLHLAAARTALASWYAHAEAARRLTVATEGLARAYLLGEGSLTDVLSARRLANEQQLALTQATVDAWLLRHRLELEAGALWPAPDSLEAVPGL
jgi:outer membrane protein TolC